ncbi:MAG: sigma factor-like helix-turn-helix DNA-binding protein, partial [Planctomycetota bacterium]
VGDFAFRVTHRSYPSGDLVGRTERARLQRELMDAVLGLAEPYRETILLRFFEGLSPSKIAARQDVSVETVKTRQKRGLAKLRERLDAQRGGDRRAWVMAFQVHLIPSALEAGGLAAAGASLMTTKTFLVPAAILAAAALYVSRPSGAQPERQDPVDPVRTEAALDAVAEEAPGAEPVDASASERAAIVAPDAEPAPAGPAPEAAPELVVEVRVIDSEGEPVPGAPVDCAIEGADSAPFGVTDRTGRIAGPMDRVEAEFAVETDRWTTLQRGAVQSIGRRAVPTVMVARPRSIEGRVLDPIGEPVAGVLVSYRTTDNPWARLEIRLDHASAPRFDVRTDETGAFRFERVPEMPESKLEVRIDATERASVAIAPEGNVFQEIRLEDTRDAARWLSGVVVDASGDPIAGAQVSRGYRCAVTGDDGMFALDTTMPTPSDALLVAAQGLLPKTIRPDADGAWPDPFFVVLDGAPLTLAGRVVRADGTPVPDARLRLLGTTDFGMVEDPEEPPGFVFHSLESYAGGSSTGKIELDEDGAFEIGGLQAKGYRIAATVADSLEAVAVGPVQAGDRSVRIVLPEVAAWTTVRGRVVDAEGEPIPAARVSLGRTSRGAPGQESSPEARGPSVVADDDGAFEFEPIAAGEGLRVRVFAGAGYPFQVRDVGGTGPEVEVVVEVPALAPFFVESGATGADSFEVRGSDGATVPLFQAEGHAMFAMDQGFFSEGKSPVFSCAEGEYEVVLLRGGEELVRRTVELKAGEPARIAF